MFSCAEKHGVCSKRQLIYLVFSFPLMTFCLHLVWLEFVYHKQSAGASITDLSIAVGGSSFSRGPDSRYSFETLKHFLMECAWKCDALALDAQLKSPRLMKCCACMSCSSLKCQNPPLWWRVLTALLASTDVGPCGGCERCTKRPLCISGSYRKTCSL